MGNARRRSAGVQSADVAAAVLKALAQAARPAPLTELARRAGMPPAKMHRYLVSLTRAEFVAQDPVSGHYGVGPAAIALGLAGLRAVNPVREALAAMPRLRDQTGETVILVLWTSAGPVVTAIEESSRPVYMNIRVGSVLPAHSASGRFFAACLPRSETARWLRGRKDAPSAQSTGRLKAMGLAAVTGAIVPGVSALAAPVFDAKGRLALVLGVLGGEHELDTRADGPIARALREAARGLSTRLGFTPGETGS